MTQPRLTFAGPNRRLEESPTIICLGAVLSSKVRLQEGHKKPGIRRADRKYFQVLNV
jgi:hypothetical protein